MMMIKEELIDIHKPLNNLLSKIKSAHISDWKDINNFVEKLGTNSDNVIKYSKGEFQDMLSQGVAFITFDFGIDGVSIEIFKYAQ